MATENPTEAIPDPKDITAIAQKVDPDDVNKIALRRGKVRELMRMGYGVHQIVLILDKGIKVSRDQTVQIPISEEIIKRDMEYIRQEDAAEDIDFSEKRAAIIDKLSFLYNRAITDYMNAKGQAKNSFLNTALGVLSKIIEVEGVKSAEQLAVNLGMEARIARFSAEIHKLSEHDKLTIISAVRKVLKERKPEGVGDIRVSSEPSRIPTQASNNGGIPRES